MSKAKKMELSDDEDDALKNPFGENYFRESQLGKGKRRGAVASGQKGGPGRKKVAFQSFRGNELPPQGKRGVNPAWSKFAGNFNGKSITLVDKPKLKALALLGGAKSVSQAGYSILAGWLDEAVEQDVIERVRHVLTEARARGIKSSTFGGHEVHFDIINSNERLSAPLRTPMPESVQKRVQKNKIESQLLYEKNKSKLEKYKPTMEAYRMMPHYQKELYRAVKLFYKLHPGLSASSLKITDSISLRKPPSLREYIQHHYPEINTPSQLTMIQTNGKLVIWSINALLDVAPAWNKWDALIAITALANLGNDVANASIARLPVNVKLVVGKFARLAGRAIVKHRDALKSRNMTAESWKALDNPFRRAIAIGQFTVSATAYVTSKQIQAAEAALSNGSNLDHDHLIAIAQTLVSL